MVSLQAAERTFSGHVPVEALSSVNLSIGRGEHVAVVGPSGSGKSTLLNVLGLLDQLTAGTYLLNGHDVSTLDERERTAMRATTIGFVFQSFHLLPYRTVLENVALGELYTGRPRRGRAGRAADALARVGMTHRLGFDPRQLSGGEKQRVAVARALIAEPVLLLCDEPTGNLDSANSGRFLDLLDSQRDSGITVVIITHDSSVSSRADRTVRLHDGAVVEQYA